MTLKKILAKRKFEKTPKPKSKILKTGENRFVVQEHWATHHHFDFRLEMEGVLKSWAIPKGIPEKVGVKRLAVAVEDHPIDYIDFEGEIPEGLYGAGLVKIFDKGKYELIEKTEKKIEFKLNSKKLKGNYSLIKFKKPNQWLIFKGVNK